MNIQLSDLDELLQLVRDKHAQEYLKEAVIAYRSGAYRASVVSTWIAICVDIIQKIRELSIGNDAAAKKLEDELNRIQPTDVRRMLNFENRLLAIANEELGIISLIEKAHLERVKEDRNICAHPTFSVDGSQFVPPAELARTYIVQAANYLLVNAPLKGKVIVESIYELIISNSFPSDKERAYQVLSSERYLGRVRDSAIKNTAIVLFKRLFKDNDKLSPDLLTQITSALSAISRINNRVFLEICSDTLVTLLAEADSMLIRLLPTLTRMPDLWRYVEEAIRHRLEEVIAKMEVPELINYRVSETASIIPSLNKYFQTSIVKLNRQNKKLLLQEIPAECLTDKAIEFFVTSESFDSAYANGTQVLLKYAEFINDERLTNTFNGIHKNSEYGINQILNASGIDEFLAMLYSKTQNDNVFEHAKLWSDFRKTVTTKGFTFKALESSMKKIDLPID